MDAHNVVPVWTASDKQETMARTIRPKIHARPDFLGPIPELSPNAAGTKLPAATDWAGAQASLDLDKSVPGEKKTEGIERERGTERKRKRSDRDEKGGGRQRAIVFSSLRPLFGGLPRSHPSEILVGAASAGSATPLVGVPSSLLGWTPFPSFALTFSLVTLKSYLRASQFKEITVDKRPELGSRAPKEYVPKRKRQRYNYGCVEAGDWKIVVVE